MTKQQLFIDPDRAGAHRLPGVSGRDVRDRTLRKLLPLLASN
jgi:hypothetical protein